MFGLHNFSGSCWVNSCLQALFRIPEVQTKYSDENSDNKIDESLQTIWKSKGEQGLKEFFDSVKTVTMPAGDSIGDAHELFQYLCDKLKFLDDICRFKIADTISPEVDIENLKCCISTC
jgi:ubiquitin C-terminal hydrolase